MNIPSSESERYEKEWHVQGDDLRAFLGDFVAALSQIEFPGGLSL
jgi:hypothetical protein